MNIALNLMVHICMWDLYHGDSIFQNSHIYIPLYGSSFKNIYKPALGLINFKYQIHLKYHYSFGFKINFLTSLISNCIKTVGNVKQFHEVISEMIFFSFFNHGAGLGSSVPQAEEGVG